MPRDFYTSAVSIKSSWRNELYCELCHVELVQRLIILFIYSYIFINVNRAINRAISMVVKLQCKFMLYKFCHAFLVYGPDPRCLRYDELETMEHLLGRSVTLAISQHTGDYIPNLVLTTLEIVFNKPLPSIYFTSQMLPPDRY